MEQLFGSKTRVKLLQLFLQYPNRAFYVREITRKIDEQINSVRRELANLLNIGILTSVSKDNRLYYEVNQKFEHYPALRALFAGSALGGEKPDANTSSNDKLSEVLKSLGSVELMIYMGEFTGDNRTGADILLVGNINKTNVNNYISELEDEEGREIRYVVMTLDEYKYRYSVNDRFLSLVLDSKKTIAHDPNGLISGTGQVTEKPKAKKKGK